METKATERQTAKIKTEIKIWSSNGHTPITNRGRNYCDLLLDAVIEIDSIDDAREKTKELIRTTKSGSKGFYYAPEYWNKNKNSGWISL
jgi:hypothetical protein